MQKLKKIFFFKVIEDRENQNYQNQSAAKTTVPNKDSIIKSPTTEFGKTNISFQTTNSETPSPALNYSQQLQQQQIDASPISTQLNKIIKKTKKDNEKKMLLNDDEF